MTEQPSVDTTPARRPAFAFGVRRLVHGLRTEGSSPARETAAIGLGVFIGCLPFYGFHLLICIAAGTLLGLNRLKLYLAANISNPLVAPLLLFAELQAGSWLRRGRFHPVTLQAVREAGVASMGVDLLIGSLAVGLTLGALAALGTWAGVRGSRADRPFLELVRRASDRYVGMSITAWEFARGKLRNDPVYRAALYDGLLAAGPRGADMHAADADTPRTLVDVGCGQGLMLALLAEVGREVREGRWHGASAPPVFTRMIGIETRHRVAALARDALGSDADIITADARGTGMPRADVVLLFDVMHLMARDDQATLLASLVRALAPGGVIVIREADAGAGWRFSAVKAGNRIKNLVVGNWGQTFHFRTADEWVAALADLGLHAEVRPMGEGTPFGNVLFRATVTEHAERVSPAMRL